jgi:hypothetical protein
LVRLRKDDDEEYEEFDEFFRDNAVPVDGATPAADFDIEGAENMYEDEDDEEGDYDGEDDDYGGGGGGYAPSMMVGGGGGQSTFAPTVLDRYDSDSLNYLKESVTDDIARDLIIKVWSAKLTPDCKMDIVSLILTFSSREYVITGYESDREMRKRWLEFRDAFNKLKAKTRLVNKTNGDLTYIISLLEGHYSNKLTRSRKGFERKAQITQNMNQTSTTTQSYAEEEPRSGLRRLFGR